MVSCCLLLPRLSDDAKTRTGKAPQRVGLSNGRTKREIERAKNNNRQSCISLYYSLSLSLSFRYFCFLSKLNVLRLFVCLCFLVPLLRSQSASDNRPDVGVSFFFVCVVVSMELETWHGSIQCAILYIYTRAVCRSEQDASMAVSCERQHQHR